MMYGNPNEIVENIKTLDEAKELILYLLKSQQMTYHVLNYEFRTPLTAIGGYAEVGQREDFRKEHPYILKIIRRYAQQLLKMIESLSDDARFGWYLHQKSLLENFPFEATDPNPTLAKSIIQIQANIDDANELSVLGNEQKKRKGEIEANTALVNFHANINEHLPTVEFNTGVLKVIMSDVIWLLSQPFQDEIFISTGFDEQWVMIKLGYSTNSSLQKVLEDYQQFENAQTLSEFYGESLFLYNTWNKLRAYGAELTLNIQERNEINKSSKMEITIRLKR